MSSRPRIYLDNAATSWPKPESVYRAVDHYQRHVGAPAGRGSYPEAIQVSRRIAQARELALELVNGRGTHAAVLTPSCTMALNMAIHGVLRPGDHVVTTVIEHNSVLRPLAAEQATRSVEVSYVDCDDAGFVDPDDVRRALKANTRLVVISHASNVTGAVQPIEAIAAIAKSHRALVLVDAAQTLGHRGVDLRTVAADFVAAAGHKGALAPLGVGLLFVRRGAEAEIATIAQGGTGTHSESDRQPDDLPDRLEPGNLDLPAIYGLAAGLEYVLERGVEALEAHSRALTKELLEGLGETAGAQVLGPRSTDDRVGVVSFQIEGYDPQEFALGLEAASRIQVRAGLHCAGRMHRRLKSLGRGGAVRVSFGPFNENAHVQSLLTALAEISTARIH